MLEPGPRKPSHSDPRPSGPRPPGLLTRVRTAIRARHYSRRTEKAYVGWIRRFIFFHDVMKRPGEMGSPEIVGFFSHLASTVAWSRKRPACPTRPHASLSHYPATTNLSSLAPLIGYSSQVANCSTPETGWVT